MVLVTVSLYTLYSTGLLLGQCGFDGVRTTPQGFLHCVFNYIRFRTLVLDTWQLMEPFFCLNWLTVRCCHWWCRWCRQWPQCHKRRRVSQHISCNSEWSNRGVSIIIINRLKAVSRKLEFRKNGDQYEMLWSHQHGYYCAFSLFW